LPHSATIAIAYAIVWSRVWKSRGNAFLIEIRGNGGGVGLGGVEARVAAAGGNRRNSAKLPHSGVFDVGGMIV
jgi:hypothetical protein